MLDHENDVLHNVFYRKPLFLIVAIKVLFVYHADNAVDIIVVYRQAGISFAVKGLFNLAKQRRLFGARVYL